jgi:hypothetical protein
VHETLESAQEQARELTRRDAKSSTISDKGISVESAQRQGVEHRDAGEDISSDKLKDSFGFKGVNFGTWMLGESPAKLAERQLHLNEPDPVTWTPRSTKSVIHGRLVRSLATNRNRPAVGNAVPLIAMASAALGLTRRASAARIRRV